MKKSFKLCLIMPFLFMISCKKDREMAAPKEDIRNITDVANQLKKDASVSMFADVLKQISVTDQELNSGITVLAVPNTVFQDNSSLKTMERATTAASATTPNPNSYSDTVSSPALNTNNIKDHIIKGIINFSQIQSGQRLKTESGKIIQVIRSGDSTWLNGLLVEKNTLLSSNKAIVYKLAHSLTNTHPRGTVSITVYNANKWAIDKPQGEPLPNYPVYLFRTQEDYAATVTGSAPRYAYMVKTDGNGSALFNDITPGKYYISAGMLNRSDTLFAEFHRRPFGSGNTLLIGICSDSLIQSTPPPSQLNALPGTFLWPDLNGDGTIDDNDNQLLPARSVQTQDEGTATARILVGTESPVNINTIKQLKNSMYANLGNFEKNRVMADGYLSQDAMATLSDWKQFNNFTFTSQSNIISELIWKTAWKTVETANSLIQIINEHPEIPEAFSYTAHAKLVRAYTYFQLVTYFGGVPLLDETNFRTDLTPARKSQNEVLNFIQADLSDAASTLQDIAENKYFPNRWAAYALLAKTYLMKKDYANAKLFSDNIINSATYKLMTSPESVFQNAENAEMLWAGINQSLPDDFKQYFYNRSVFPYIRYAEVLLMNAEAVIESGGNFTIAQTELNILQIRSNRALVPALLTQNEMRHQLYVIQKAEAPREGYHFANLVRLGLAAQELSAAGFKPNNTVLPIPVSALIKNPNMIQNQGY